MKLFKCQNCANLLYFENSVCQNCGLQTGYIPELEVMSAVEPNGTDWSALADREKTYRFCQNWERQACNWLVKAETGESFCRACQHNRTIPDIADPKNHGLWITMERAKRRLFYSLMKFRLPLPLPSQGNPQSLEFEFLTDAPGHKVMTGPDNGNITISLREADDAEREKLRTGLNEPYRTLLGHFRHEVGHFYWDILVRDGGQLESCRAVFGDDSIPYEGALAQYYQTGPKADWQESFVSAYATMHPWEDFAETWAHYLHIVDTLEMAYAFGMTVAPRIDADETLQATIERNPYKAASIAELIAAWLPISFAANSLNRTMGQPDLYPFVISEPAVTKLGYIHQLIHNNASEPRTI